MEKRKSRLALAVEKKKRPDHGPFELPPGFVGPDARDVAKVQVRVLVKTEENNALMGAHKALKEMVYDGSEAALDDSDFTADVKAIHALYKAIRDDDDPMYPAFFDQEWMASKFTTDKIQWLLNLYFACRRDEEVMQWAVEDNLLEAKLQAIAVCGYHTDLEEAVIADCTETWLRSAFILCAYKLMQERKALWRTRQLLAMSVKWARSAAEDSPVAPSEFRELSYWASAVESEMSYDTPWRTLLVKDRGWIGLRTVAQFDDAAEAAQGLMVRAAELSPPLTPEEEAELAAAAETETETEPEAEAETGERASREADEEATVLEDPE